MDESNGMDKPWDHPWSTDEMRKKRREWSLAGDVGLLKHLQQFSENLTSKANKTQEVLDSLTTQLNETAILIDNVTNTSLALANTQFIESRVQEDDIEVEHTKPNVQQGPQNEEQIPKDLIINVCESIKQGLNIMDEKYRKMEVVDSESEDEDDKVLSVILGPNDPYQDRPLPYVIGSEKWKASSKIGLESSSSDSEQLEEDEEDSDSEKNNIVKDHIFNANNKPSRIARLSSSSGESDNFSRHSDNAAFQSNGKLDGISQNKVAIDSELATPAKDASKVNPTPNFAEELAKRLGNVRQVQKPVAVDEANEPSINRCKDDLFAAEHKEDLFSKKSEDLFRQDKGIFDETISSKFWNEDTMKPFKGNVIPASIDVPPPISAISTKPKSAIDDLFGDADSEDSDDIFSPKKNYAKKTSKESKETGERESLRKKHLDTLIGTPTSVATSTPTNLNADNLFNDDEDEEGDLFGSYKKQLPKPVESSPSLASSTSTQNKSRKEPIGGVSILGNVLASEIKNKFSSRMLQHRSSESSTDVAGNSDTAPTTASVSESTVRNVHSNNSTGDESLIGGNLANENLQNLTANAESGDSSGISIRPPSINNTAGSNVGADFQPQLTSSRLKSEEIYRERVLSDSLFVTQTRERGNTTSNSAAASDNRSRDDRNGDDESLSRQDDVFDNEDLFGPPPLPANNSKTSKSKVQSLFDDSDSGDELFSTTSSIGSRSAKSTDFLQGGGQFLEKSKAPGSRRGLFDEDVDIFGSKDAPDVDIFGIVAAKPKSSRGQVDSSTTKPLESNSEDLFDRNSKAKTRQGKPVAPKPPEEPPDDLFADPISPARSLQEQVDSPTRTPQKNLSEDLFVENATKTKAHQVKPEAPKVPNEPPEDLFADTEEDPADTDIFSVAAKPVPETKQSGLTDLFVDELSKKPSSIMSVPKKTSLFDDDDDDDEDDLFGVKSPKKVSKAERIFEADDQDDLFATKLPAGPAESSIGKQMSLIEPGMSDSSTIEPVQKRTTDTLFGETSSLTSTNKRGDALFDDDVYDDLFSKKSQIIEAGKEDKANKPEAEVKGLISIEKENESVKEKVQTLDSFLTKPKSDEDPRTVTQKEVKDLAENIQHQKDLCIEKEIIEPEDSSAIEPEGKKHPPKTLNLRGNELLSEENAQLPRRAVSGKIKDLMGKMGDLKILSPTDTPPLWRRSEEKTDEEDDDISGKDSDDGGCISIRSRGSPPSISEGSTLRTQSPRSTVSGSSNAESAVSFDQPVQIETLSAASKNRVRVPAKRRPQSRHARQTALRKSGIDFDTVDAKASDEAGENESSREITTTDMPSVISITNAEDVRNTDSNLFVATDDKSELGSISKESSMSANKNTLLSPSTDEEDLFDVPPDLPDDTMKEDALFGRAPLLSPIERIPVSAKPLRETFVGKTEVVEDEGQKRTSSRSTEEKIITPDRWRGGEENHRGQASDQLLIEKTAVQEVAKKDSGEIRGKEELEGMSNEPVDPLRDTTHDPLKDPSQLFAFVTKTPSPEKGKSVLFADDNSLFSSRPRKSSAEKQNEKKSALGLFEDDDTGGDLFSAAPLTKPVKKPLKDTKIGLFDDEPPADNDEDNLFRTVSKKSSKVEKSKKSAKLFDDLDDDDTDLFSERSERTSKASSSKGSDVVFKDEPPPITGKQSSTRTTNLDDIFGDNSSGEDDLFATKKPLSKKSLPTKSVFPEDREEEEVQEDSIFGKSTRDAEYKLNGSRVVLPKKSLTRDLRKTAEKIDQDPLSLAQDD